MKETRLTAFFDGACPGNPGSRGIGAVILDGATPVAEISRAIGYGTNNEAEWSALIALLELIIEKDLRGVSVFGDSLLVVNGFNKRWKVKAANLKPFARKAMALAARVPGIKVAWVPREENKLADNLATAAIAEGYSVLDRLDDLAHVLERNAAPRSMAPRAAKRE